MQQIIHTFRVWWCLNCSETFKILSDLGIELTKLYFDAKLVY
jgi:hypothetical protein